MKICSKCKQEKKLSEFHKDKRNNDGLLCHCKKCAKQIAKKYYQNNKNRLREQSKKYRETHQKEIKHWRFKNKDKLKKYFQTNRVKIQIRRKKHYIENRDKIRLYLETNKSKIQKQQKKYYIKHREEIIQYRLKNKQHLNKCSNRLRQQRRTIDVEYRILICLRSRLSHAIKNNIKSLSTKELLGCTVKFLKKRLEARFKKGMTWKNHGTGQHGKRQWHIDHIKPCASFDLSKPEEQRKCFHYTNLQPLWSTENWKKGSNK